MGLSCQRWGVFLACARSFLVVAHQLSSGAAGARQLRACGLSCSAAQWDLSSLNRDEPWPSALQGGFLTTEPLGKSPCPAPPPCPPSAIQAVQYGELQVSLWLGRFRDVFPLTCSPSSHKRDTPFLASLPLNQVTRAHDSIRPHSAGERTPLVRPPYWSPFPSMPQESPAHTRPTDTVSAVSPEPLEQ